MMPLQSSLRGGDTPSVWTFATCFYAFSELRHRLGVTLLCLFACTISSILLWQLGAIAAGITASREERLAAEEPTAVRVRVAEAGDKARWFDDEQLRRLRALPWVAGGGPLVEVHVMASLHAGKERLVPAEGDVRVHPPGPAALAWGCGSAGPGDVMLSRSLLESLGGSLGEFGPEPRELHISLERTVDGVDQRHVVALQIAGVLKRESDTDRIDIHRVLAMDLDRWCQGEEVEGMPRRAATADRSSADADFADLTVRSEHVGMLRHELDAMGVDVIAEPAGADARSLGLRVMRRDGKRLDRRQLVQIELVQPAVVSVKAGTQAAASCGGLPLRVVAFAGRTVGPRSVLWPVGLGRMRLGDAAVLEFVADDGAACRLECAVAGLVSGSEAIVATALLAEIEAWRAGRLAFDPVQVTFSPVRPAVRVASCLRATIYATSLETVEPLVGHLHRLGYETTDQLERYAAVRWFGRALAMLVACVVVSTLLLSVLMVVGMNTQKLAVSVFEIGLLRAHAVSDRSIIGIYAMQGLALGSAALGCAIAVQGMVASTLRSALADAFGIDHEALAVSSAFGPDGLVFTVVFVCLGCGVAGTALPAWWTCRSVSPVAALRHG